MSENDRIVEDDSPDFPVAWRGTLDGFTAEIVHEQDDASFANPRDDANLGTMVCWHPDYVLGDEQIAGDSDRGTRGAIKRDRNGSASSLFQTENGRSDFRSMEVIERYLRLARGAVCILPLYLYDHSGISIRAGSPSPFDNPTVRRDHHGQGLGWDTTMVGYIYTTAERIRELCGEPQVETDPFYCPRTWPEDGRSGPNWTGTAHDWIAEQLDVEVRLYDAYLRGEVYFWRVEDANGAVVESCGGYLPDVGAKGSDGLDYLKEEARETLQSVVDDKRKADDAERVERDRAARMDIATVSA